MAGNRLQGRIGDPLGRIDDFRRVAEVENELLRVGEVSLDPLSERELECGVALGLGLRDPFGQLANDRVACGQIGRKHDCLRHARIMQSTTPLTRAGSCSDEK